MEIEEYPQLQLYLLTLNLLRLKEKIIPENCNERCVDATIINRAYYSSYLHCLFWLKKFKDFKPKHPWEFKKKEKRMGEHKQVRKALYRFGEGEVETELRNLAYLRNEADYNPSRRISPKDVDNAIGHMKKIFNQLEFE